MDEFVSPEELRRQQMSGPGPTVVDVRGAEEYAAGHVPGAIHIPAEELPRRLGEVPQDRAVVTY
jgi:rhodanese-related sulfurtransferase